MRRALTITDLPVGTVFVHRTCTMYVKPQRKQYIGIVYTQYDKGKLEERHICVHYDDGDSEVFFNDELPENKIYILERL